MCAWVCHPSQLQQLQIFGKNQHDSSSETSKAHFPQCVSWFLNIIVRICPPVALLKQLAGECRSPPLHYNPHSEQRLGLNDQDLTFATKNSVQKIRREKLRRTVARSCDELSREVATNCRGILRRSVARFCDAPSRDFVTLHREVSRHQCPTSTSPSIVNYCPLSPLR